MNAAIEPPQFGGVRCRCGEEVLPYVLANGVVGVHFMDEGDSPNTGTTLQAEVMDLFAGWTCRDGGLDANGIAHIQEFRATLAACVDLIDYELSVRHVRTEAAE